MFKKLFLFFCITLPVTVFGIDSYTTLAPIPNVGSSVSINGGSGLSSYLNNIYILGISLCTGLAVLMIVIGGIEYMGSGSWSGKDEGKERIKAALLGLLVALGSWVILNTLDTRFLNTNLNVQQVSVQGAGAGSIVTPQTAITTNPQNTNSNGFANNVGNFNNINNTGNTTNNNQTQSPAQQTTNNNAQQNLDKIAANLVDQGMLTTIGTVPGGSQTTALSMDNKPSPTSQDIQSVITAANNNGYTAVYNTPSQSEYQNLLNNGIPASNINYTKPNETSKQTVGFILTSK